MTGELTRQIRKRSINNTRLGKVLTKNDTTYTLRIDNTIITCDFGGALYIGEYATVVCPEGDFTKAYILSAAKVGIGEGGNVAI